MTSTQLAEWEAMYARWHMGDAPHERDDLSAAIVASTIANSQPGRKRAVPLDTFLPTFTEPVTQEQSADALRDRMLKLAAQGKRQRAKRGDDKQAPG